MFSQQNIFANFLVLCLAAFCLSGLRFIEGILVETHIFIPNGFFILSNVTELGTYGYVIVNFVNFLAEHIK